jgi:hypothetical protein
MMRIGLLAIAGIAGVIAVFGLIIFALSLHPQASPPKAVPILASAIGALVAIIAYRISQRLEK